MSTSAFTLAEGQALLERTPVLLNGWLRGLDAAWLDSRTEGPESYSPRDIVGHLISGERTDWMVRARIIKEHGEKRTFEPFDRLGFKRESAGKSMDQLLDEFARLRTDNLVALRALALTPADMARRGSHPDPSFEAVTLGQLLATWVAHDLSHIAQIARVMGKRYSEDVGPWKQYLPMLSR